MVEEDKRKLKRTELWLIGTLFLVSIIAVAAFLINDNNNGSDVEISGSESVSGIKCTDTAGMSFIFQDYQPTSHVNTITAAFMAGKLTSITYAYEGQYTDATEADHARDYAEAKYGLTLTEDYGLEYTAFTKDMSVSGDKLYMNVTATDGKNLSAKTAPIFMLEQGQNFPATLEEMKKAYENIGFSCVVEN